MRTTLTELLTDAAAEHAAVGAFTCYDLAQAAGVLDAAESAGRGVILLVSPASFRASRGSALVAGLDALGRDSSVPVCVQLDHVSDLASVEAAFAAGAGAVMLDGSHLELDGNIELTRAAVRLAADAGGEVECELGGIAGDEDVAEAIAAGALTDPEEAADFVAGTGAACLAVSIGNVHGHYREPPQLDFERLRSVRRRVDCAISLHGASGLPEEQVRTAIGLGVVKVNVNTELRERYLDTLRDGLDGWMAGAKLGALTTAVRDATAVTVAEKLALLGPVAV
jgi:tagatose 1,6-diphosphate aldolase GatY/KbaY